jgi:Mn2+/Fe2+ NRAMP family transporter
MLTLAVITSCDVVAVGLVNFTVSSADMAATLSRASRSAADVTGHSHLKVFGLYALYKGLSFSRLLNCSLCAFILIFWFRDYKI